MEILTILTPLLSTLITAISAVAVAKIHQVKKAIETNHGSSSLGDAVDMIHEQLEDLRNEVSIIADSTSHLASGLYRVTARLDVVEDKARFLDNRKGE